MKAQVRTATVGGPLAVAGGAALWGTDALFRLPLSAGHAAATIVFVEHLILVLCVLPLLPRTVRAIRRADWRTGLALVVIGAGSSAAATVLFTQAFTYGDPVTPLLLQKLQPLFAVAAAWFLLGERPRRAYGPLLVGGVLGAYLLAFPDPTSVGVAQLTPAVLAAAAAALWAMGTVLGRYASRSLAAQELLAARITIGLPASGILVVLMAVPATVPSRDVPAVLGLALVPGLIALAVYYVGLRRTPAMIATLAELAFPLTAALIGRLVFGETLTVSQWSGLALLLIIIVLLAAPSAVQRGKKPELVLSGN